MGIGGKGKNQQNRFSVRKNDQKQRKGSGNVGTNVNANKPPVEKRTDPSDGNGPFTQASFIKFHGDEQGLALWKKAGKMGNNKNTNGGNNTVRKGGNKNNQNNNQNVGMKGGNNNNRSNKGGNNNQNGGNQNNQNGGNQNNQNGGNQNGGKAASNQQNGGNKGKGKRQTSAEKRVDPSDGNGPFSLASFIKYHGEELGQELWDQAGEGENNSGRVRLTANKRSMKKAA